MLDTLDALGPYIGLGLLIIYGAFLFLASTHQSKPRTRRKHTRHHQQN